MPAISCLEFAALPRLVATSAWPLERRLVGTLRATAATGRRVVVFGRPDRMLALVRAVAASGRPVAAPAGSVAITVGASLVVAVLAELMSGELVLNNLQGMDTSALLAAFVLVYGLSQFVYSTLNQSPKTAGAVN